MDPEPTLCRDVGGKLRPAMRGVPDATCCQRRSTWYGSRHRAGTCQMLAFLTLPSHLTLLLRRGLVSDGSSRIPGTPGKRSQRAVVIGST